MRTFKVNKELKENMSELADVENKDFGVVDNVYAAAIRDFRKTKKQKEDAVEVKEAEKLNEKPKKPEMNKGAKQMKLEKLMLEESLFESVNGVMTRDELLKDANLKDTFNKLQDENNILLSNWRDFNDLESFAYAGTIHHDTDRDGSEILFYNHFGSSAVKYTLEEFRWLIEEIFDEKGLHFLLTTIKEFNDKKEEFYNREFDKRQRELNGLNESLEDAEKLRGEYFEFPNGEVFTIDFKDGKLIAGGLTNAGVMPEFEIEYDDDFSADWNLQVLYDVCIEARPELLGRYSDEYLKERDTKQESIKTRKGARRLDGLKEDSEIEESYVGDLEKDLQTYCDLLEKDLKAQYPNSEDKFTFKKGEKFYKVLENGNSVHAFVDENGNIYKPAGWRAPAKGVRARLKDIVSGDHKVDWAGGYLYSSKYNRIGESIWNTDDDTENVKHLSKEEIEKLYDKYEIEEKETITDAYYEDGKLHVIIVNEKGETTDYQPTEEKLEENKIEPDVAGFVKEIKDVLDKKDINTHESDLYVRVSPKSTELLKKYNLFGNPLLTTFTDQIENDRWYDIPFGNLGEFVENETKELEESKQLNEGAGAGYTIEGELHDIVVNKINNIEIHDGETAFGTPAKFARIDLDADALFDGSANSYYYGDTLDDAKVKITSLDVNPNLIYDLGLPEFEYDKVELVDLNDRLGFGSTLKFKSDVIGGGWSHLPFDGKAKSTRVDDDYMSYVDGIEFEFVEPSDVEFIDKAVQGETDIEENGIEEE